MEDIEKKYKRMANWRKENMKPVTAYFKKDFVGKYKEACKKLGIKQSDPIREAVEKTIKKANK